VHSLHTLQSQIHRILDDYVEPQFANQPLAILNRQSKLALELQTVVFQLNAECGLVNRFEKTGAEVAMNFDCTADDFVSQRIFLRVSHFYSDFPSVCSVTLWQIFSVLQAGLDAFGESFKVADARSQGARC
jgi:hypothetical protein